MEEVKIELLDEIKTEPEDFIDQGNIGKIEILSNIVKQEVPDKVPKAEPSEIPEQTKKETKKPKSNRFTKDSKQLSCPLCQREFQDLRKLRNHIHYHRAKNRYQQSICDLCGKILNCKRTMRKHIDRVHLKEKRKRVNCDEPGCDRSFHRLDGLRLHKMNVHGAEANFTCPICGMKFEERFRFERHTKGHLGKAVVAPKKTPTRYNKSNCQYCDKSFRDNTNLQRHVTRVHLNIRTFHCTFGNCHKSFFDQNTLDFHMGRHTGIFKHPCTACQEQKGNARGFRTGKELENHINEVHVQNKK